MNSVEITVNSYQNTRIDMTEWKINEEEPERVGVRFKNKEYILVLDKSPYFEIYGVDEAGELGCFEQRIHPQDQVDELLKEVGI